MSENLNYISDEELERLIAQVEQEELVAAPPDLMEHILEAESKIYSEAVGGYSEEAECVLTARTITVELLSCSTTSTWSPQSCSP